MPEELEKIERRDDASSAALYCTSALSELSMRAAQAHLYGTKRFAATQSAEVHKPLRPRTLRK